MITSQRYDILIRRLRETSLELQNLISNPMEEEKLVDIQLTLSKLKSIVERANKELKYEN